MSLKKKVSMSLIKNCIALCMIRMEKVDISKYGGQAKTVGTVVAFSGATLMTLYKGIKLISIASTLVHTQHSHQTPYASDKDWIKGSLMIFVSCLSFSAFYVLQVHTYIYA